MGKQYWGDFYDINNQQWTIELWRGATGIGTEYEIIIADAEIDRQGDNNKIHENPIRSSRATVTWVMRDENDYGNFENIATDEEQKWAILIKKGATLHWVGRVLADEMQFEREPEETGYARITVTAVDTLKILEGYDLDTTIFNINSRTDFADIVGSILRSTELSDYWGASDPFFNALILHVNTAMVSQVPLSYTTAHVNAFAKTNDFLQDPAKIKYASCSEALAHLCQFYNARICHENGVFWIYSVIAIYDTEVTHNYIQYKKNGDYVSITPATFNSTAINIDTTAVRPKFEAKPVFSFQPPVRRVQANYEKANGKIGTRTTASNGVFSSTHDAITNGGTPPGYFCNVQFAINFNFDNAPIYKYRMKIKVYGRNPTTNNFYRFNNGAWFDYIVGSAPPIASANSIAYTDIDIHEPAWASGTHTIFHNIAVPEPPSGVSEVSVAIYLQRLKGTISGKSGLITWGTPTITDHDFTIRTQISQSYENTEPYSHSQHAESSVDLNDPRDINSIKEEVDFAFYNGRIYDFGTPLIWDGSTWVVPGNWSVPIGTSFAGNISELFCNIVAGSYSNFVPSISATIHDSGSVTAMKSLEFDNRIWIFNAGAHNLRHCTWQGEWLAIETNYSVLTSGGEGQRVIKQDDKGYYDDRLGELRQELSRIREVADGQMAQLPIDLINEAIDAPTADPGVDKTYSVLLDYTYDADTPALAFKLAEYGGTGVVGTLNVNTTPVSNVGAGEDDVITYTVPGSTLAANHDYLTGDMSGTFAASLNNKRLRVKFGATTIFDSGALAITSATEWALEFIIIRTGAAAYKAACKLSTTSATLSSYVDYATGTDNLLTDLVLKMTGEGTSDNDITQQFSVVKLNSSATDALLSYVAKSRFKQTEVDFGSTPVDSAIFTITDTDAISGSKIMATLAYDAPTGKDLDELDMDNLNIKAGNAAVGTFEMHISAADGSYLADKFKINYAII